MLGAAAYHVDRYSEVDQRDVDDTMQAIDAAEDAVAAAKHRHAAGDHHDGFVPMSAAATASSSIHYYS
jgi:hypothetical protein